MGSGIELTLSGLVAGSFTHTTISELLSLAEEVTPSARLASQPLPSPPSISPFLAHPFRVSQITPSLTHFRSCELELFSSRSPFLLPNTPWLAPPALCQGPLPPSVRAPSLPPSVRAHLLWLAYRKEHFLPAPQCQQHICLRFVSGEVSPKRTSATETNPGLKVHPTVRGWGRENVQGTVVAGM